MAHPIPLRQTPPVSVHMLDTLLPAISQHAEAIESACQLLQLLHDRGVLNFLRGLVGAGDEVVAALAQAVDTPDVIRALRNFLLLTGFFASVPTEALDSLVQTAIEGARNEESVKPPGFLDLYRRMRSENVRRALAVMLDLAASMGKGL